MRLRPALSLALAIFCGIPIAAKSQNVKFNVGDPMIFGMGYNTLTGTYAGNCTMPVVASDIKPAGDDMPTPGQLSQYRLQSVESLETLSELMDFSASASASFVAGSVSASAEYVHSRTFNAYHQFVYVSADVANDTKVWTKPQLLPEMEKLRHTAPLQFLNRCGDAFVRTITTGGELSAVVDLSVSASEDKSSLDVAISGNYGNAEGKAKLHEALAHTLLNRQTNVYVLHAGGKSQIPSYSADDLIAESLTFPDEVRDHSWPMLAQVASYDTISTPATLTLKQERFIRPLFRLYKQGMQYLGDLTYMNLHSSEFRILIVPAAAAAATHKVDPATLKREDKAGWEAYSTNRANDPRERFDQLLTRRQKEISTDFDFKDLDKTQLKQTIAAYEKFQDDLELLALGCLRDPDHGCSGSSPDLPAQIEHVIRTFPEQQNWDTAAGPVLINLDPAYVCKVVDILGTWRIADAPNAPVLSCDVLPKSVTDGHIVTGGFDSYYPDNHGVCSYQFLCYRR